MNPSLHDLWPFDKSFGGHCGRGLLGIFGDLVKPTFLKTLCWRSDWDIPSLQLGARPHPVPLDETVLSASFTRPHRRRIGSDLLSTMHLKKFDSVNDFKSLFRYLFQACPCRSKARGEVRVGGGLLRRR